MQNIAPGLYTFDGLLMGRVYLIEDPDGLTIIDGGISRSTSAIIRQIIESGRKLTDIKRILLTHAHVDHVGALAVLRDQSGATLITSEGEKPYAEGALPVARADPANLSFADRLMAFGPPSRFTGITVDRTVSDGDVIESMGGLQVVATPGHAPGHVSYWQPERRILFTGDVMMHLFGKLRLPFAAYTVDMAENKRSVQKVAQLEPLIACFGHGVPLTQNTGDTIKAFAQRIGTA